MAEAQAQISSGRRLTPIWILPLVALALGLWAVGFSLSNEGPTVEVRFETGAGLVEGKTKVKYRDVEVGLVKDIRLSRDHQSVVATIELDKETEDLLREGTRFWVVTAQVSGASVTGLDTLLSGAYVEFSPGAGDKGVRQYEALTSPPQTPVGAPGLRLQLSSRKTHSLNAGDPVLFRGYKVGRVESRDFDLEQRRVHYQIFVDAPYHELVDSSVRFWDASGITVRAGAEGFEVDTASLETLLRGGVSFARPEGFDKGVLSVDGDQFRLYRSQEQAFSDPFRNGRHYVVRFDQSLRGLTAGAPVEYRGIRLGHVVRIMISEASKSGRPGEGSAIPVLIYIEAGRMQMGDSPENVEMLHESLVTGVRNGMRASMGTGNILTGATYIDLDFMEGEEPAEVGEFLGYPTLPAAAGGFARIGQQVSTLLSKINALPIGETVAGVNGNLAQLEGTLTSLREILEKEQTQALTVQLQALLQELRVLVAGVSPQSSVYQSLDASLRELNQTLSNMTDLTETLSAKPNAVVMPVTIPDDPIPEARP